MPFVKNSRLWRPVRQLPLLFASIVAVGCMAGATVSETTALLPADPSGTLPGSFSVNSNGAALYTIALATPPATLGVGPALSVVYDSQQPNGLLGVGFTLQGVDQITRCKAHVTIDGYNGAIGFNAKDRFCLGGQRLIKISGSGDYGAAGSIYHTEKETWTQVEAVGVCGSGPCSFTVTTKQGWTANFTATLTVPNKSEKVFWQVSSISDTHGNTETFSYQSDATHNQSLPIGIDYTSNSALGLKALMHVQLVYESRPDVTPAYSGGVLFATEQRLSSIVTSTSGVTVLVYQLGYDISSTNGSSLLTSIQQCSGSGDCLPATTISWTQSTNAVTPPGQSPTGIMTSSACAGSIYSYTWTDFNGDGLPDLVCDGSDGTHLVAISNGVTLQPATSVVPAPWCTATAGSTSSSLDFNGDQKADTACATSDGTQQVRVSTGQYLTSANSTSDGTVKTGWCKASNQCHISYGNFSDDGRADLLCDCGDGTSTDTHDVLLSNGNTVVSPNSTPDGTVKSNWCTAANAWTFWADFNGDGMIDLFCAVPQGPVSVMVSTGSGVQSPNSSATGLIASNWCTGAGDHLGTVDLNGDGNVDLYCRSEDGTQRALLSTGSGLVSPNSTADGRLFNTAWCAGTNASVSWGDFNGDGLPDLLCYSNGAVSILVAKAGPSGITLASPNESATGLINTGWCTGAGATVHFADINGDGLQDIVCDQTDGTHKALVHDAPFPNLATTITNGIAGSVSVTYAPLTDSTVYTRTTQATPYPILSAQTPMQVVSAYTIANGYNWQQTISQGYTGLLIDLGRGQWLGFQSMTSIEQGTGRKTTTTYDQTFPAQGFQTDIKLYGGNGALLSDTLGTPLVTTPYPNVNQVVPARVIQQVYYAGAVAYTTDHVYQYDTYGDLTLDSNLGDPNQPDQALYTCNKYSNDTVLWRLGYPVERKVTRTQDSCASFLAASSTSWNPATDLRWQKYTYDSAMDQISTAQWNDQASQWIISQTGYNPIGKPTSMTDPAGNVTTIGYQLSGLTLSTNITTPATANAGPLTASSAVDIRFGTEISQTDANANQLTSVLDTMGRMVQTWGPDASGISAAPVQLQARSFATSGQGSYVMTLTRQDWSDGNTQNWPWQQSYTDGLGRPIRTAAGGSGGKTVVTQTLYDAAGLKWQVSLPYYDGDPAYWVITTYDDLNRPVGQTLPNGLLNKWNYVQGGAAATTVTETQAYGTPDARTTTTYIDARGDTIKHVAANQAVSTYAYDPILRLINTIGPNQNPTTITYDSLGQPVAQTDSDTGASKWVYDAAGRLGSATDGSSNTVTLLYDSLNRVTLRSAARTGAATITTAFDYDQAGFANSKGELTTITRPQSVEQFGYSPYGLITAETVSVAGNSYSFTNIYDPLQRITLAAYPDSAVAQTSYDQLGNIVTVALKDVDSTDFTTYATYSNYTALGQPGNIAYRNGIQTKNTYYPINQQLGLPQTATLIQQTAASGAPALLTTNFTWNVFGQIAKLQRQHEADPPQTTSYGYQTTGWLGTAGSSGVTSSYGYDPAGNLSLKEGVTYAFKPNTNQVVSGNNGLTVTYGGDGTMSGQTLAGATWCYQYDTEANLQAVLKSTAVVSSTAPCSDLTSFSQVLGATYDENGQRLIRTDPDGTQNLYVSGDFEERQTGGARFQTKYLEGPDGRIASITREVTDTGNAPPNHTPATAPGPGLKTGDAGWSSPSSAGILLALLAGVALMARAVRRRPTGFARRHKVFAAAAPVVAFAVGFTAIPTPGVGELGPGNGYPVPGELYFHHDQVDSVVLVTDSTGAQVSQLQYQPFGTVASANSSGPDIFRQKFTAKELDENTGLIYFGARYYSGDLGRFVEPDPADQFASPYLYAANDPQTLVDPDGRFVELLVIAVAAVIGAYFGGEAVNHSYNPADWNWNRGKTYAGIFAGAAIGAAGGYAGAAAAEIGGAVGLAGTAAVGSAEDASFAALGNGSSRDIAFGAVAGGVLGGAAEGAAGGLGALGSRLAPEEETATSLARGRGRVTSYSQKAFQSSPRREGGKNWVSSRRVNADEVQSAVNDSFNDIVVLSGTHGNKEGNEFMQKMNFFYKI